MTVTAGIPLSGSAWVQVARPAAGDRPQLDGVNVPVEAYLPHRFSRPAALFKPGAHTLDLQVLDAAGRPMIRVYSSFTVTPHG
ncbi:hypothetical protein [Deinococcus hopiensis]|uniref:hypothetical protein n=1 Tax=Deinococcus hopiensis TaxID=309885 RepID=UPI000A022BC9|nr:hypothetical protein [Deinococcus hopiensis]